MQRVYEHIEFRVKDGIYCAHIKHHKLEESGLDELSEELARLVDEDGCRKLVLCLGPGDFECLYSVFLAKLINLQRRLREVGGTVVLAEGGPNTLDVFRTSGLEKFFRFYPDELSAISAIEGMPG
jgi:anti-anti-sigma factor